MSLISRIVLTSSAVIAFIYLVYAKGLPAPPPPDPEAVTDIVLQPMLAVAWGLLGYFISALIFGFLITLIVRLARILLDLFLSPPRPDVLPLQKSTREESK
ncbi:hypothetical protein DESA109040_05780 [Deinococcus saxicola]|uniref:hypothetical protein n=1 Tax=Deinococcus saxicola TaxID=249406 RepID=UPI0039F0907D